MFAERLAEYLASDRPAFFTDATVFRLVAECGDPIPQLLRSARTRGESPPEYFLALDRLCERILESCGNDRLCAEYDVPLNTAKTELKNTLNFACWDVFDELQNQT